MLRSRSKHLKLGIGGARCVNEKFASEREGIELVFQAQAFELEDAIDSHENVVALESHGSDGRLGQVSIGLQRFVKHLHLPPVFCRSW